MHTHPYFMRTIAAERIADRHREAARRRLVSRARSRRRDDPRLRDHRLAWRPTTA
jgi:hypothetical protein